MDDAIISTCVYGDDTFKRAVHDLNYRLQVLHHAMVFQLDHVLFIVASGLQFIYAVLITIPLAYRQTYESFLHGMKREHLDWAYGDVPFPSMIQDNISSKGYVVDEACIHLHLRLSRCLWNIVVEHGKPLPQGKHLIPTIVAYWNRNKGGVDVLSRFLKHVKIPFGRASPRVVYVVRMIFMLIFSGFQAWKLHNGRSTINSATNYQLLKQKLTRDTSFKSFLYEVGIYFYLPGAVVTIMDDVPAATQGSAQIRTLVTSVGSYRYDAFRTRPELISVRMNVSLRHEHVQIGKRNGKSISRKCQLCQNGGSTTTLKCSICETPLCKTKRGHRLFWYYHPGNLSCDI